MFVPKVNNGKTDTVVGILNTSDVSCTLQSGNFTDPDTGSAPTYKIWLCFEPTSATLAEWAYCTVAGTAVTQMVRPNPKTHTIGCEVRWVHPADSINNLLLHMEDGWTAVPSHVTATYASASTFTLAGDWTAVLSKGDKLRLTNSTTKYFYVTGTGFGSGVTTVTVTGGSDYALASGAVTAVCYSKAESPAGHPLWFAFSPALSGWGVAPTVSAARFSMSGRTVYVEIACTGGTSNNTGTAFTAPVAARNASSFPCQYMDNGVNSVTPGRVVTTSGTAAISVFTNYLAGAWTAGNGKGFQCSFPYEAN